MEADPYAMPCPVQPLSNSASWPALNWQSSLAVSSVSYNLVVLFAGAKEAVKNALSRWGRKVGEATRKAEDLSRNTWQHCQCFIISVFL